LNAIPGMRLTVSLIAQVQHLPGTHPNWTPDRQSLGLLLRRNHLEPDVDVVRHHGVGKLPFTDLEVAALER